MIIRYGNDLKEYIIMKILERTPVDTLYTDVVENHGYQGNRKTFGDFVRNLINSNDSTNYFAMYHKFAQYLQKNKFTDIASVVKDVGCDFTKVFDYVKLLRASGKEVIMSDDRIYLSNDMTDGGEEVSEPLADKEIIFGVCADLHYGSNYCQITALNEYAEICKKEGVKHMLCAGDITAGLNVYRGQMFEVYALSAEEQENTVITNLPTGLEWYLMGGNHDRAFLKGNGHNTLRVIENYRDDVHYVGFDEAVIPLLPGVDLKMWHPSGGNSYALSYRMQKAAEQTTISEMQRIVQGAQNSPTTRFFVAGHLHVQMQCMIGSMMAMQAGCFEGTNSYLITKGLVPSIGGWIVKATLGENGKLRNFDCKFYMFDEIEDDWKNYKHDFDRGDGKVKPLFA